MKKSILILLFIGIVTETFAQILNQDADGKSTIVWNGTSLGLGLPEGLIKINYYSISKDKEDFVWGVDLQGKSESGTADLFKKGKFTPKTEMSVLGGWHKTYFYMSADYKNVRLALDRLHSESENSSRKASESYIGLIESTIQGCKDKGVIDQETKEIKGNLKSIKFSLSLVKEVLQVVSNVDVNKCLILIDEIEELADSTENDTAIKKYFDNQKKIDEYEKKVKEIEKVDNARLLVYLRGGLNTLNFKMDLGQSVSIFDDRFVDTTDVNLFGEVGLTYQWDTNFVGFSVGPEQANNFPSGFSRNDFKYTTTDTSLTKGMLQQTSEVTAYTGDLKTFTRLNLNIDYLRLFSLNENESKYLSLSAYFRQRFALDTDLDDHITVLGGGAYLINGKEGKFLGGLYLQSDDLFGNQDGLGKTIRFGLITKFALSNLFPEEIN